MTYQTVALVERLRRCVYCGGAKRFQIVSPVADHSWADCFCTRAILAAMPEATAQAAQIAALTERVEQEITAWAFANNIDGAARNDLMRRIRAALGTER